MKDFSRFLPANLIIRIEQGTYSVAPPTKAVGTQLAAILAVAGARIRGEDPAPKDVEAITAPDELELGKLSLGVDVFDQMNTDSVPGAHIDRLASYALWYWVLGEETANSLAAHFEDAPDGGDGATGPKGSTAPKSGRSTASAPPTKTGSSSGTATRPKASDRKPPTKAKTTTPSPGSGSSATGG